MEEITLQLRQQESSNVQQNGVYSTTLAHPIELRPGDQVSVKSVFLDTTDVINIPDEGLDVSLTGCKYLVNYNINQNYNYVQPAAAGVAPLSQYGTPGPGGGLGTTGDNELYWLADAMASTNHSPYFVVNCNVIPTRGGKGQRKGKRYGGCDIPIQFTDPQFPDKPFAGRGTLHVASYQIDEFKKHNPIPVPSQARDKEYAAVTFTCASNAGVKEIRVEPGFVTQSFNIDEVQFVEDPEFTPQPIAPTAGFYIISPQYFTWTATIPGGDYTPTEIAATLNDLLTPLEYNGPTSANYNHDSGGNWDGAATKFPVQSPFLETILQNNEALKVTAAADGNTHVQCLINASRRDPTNPTVLAANAGQIPRKFEIDKMVAEYATAPFVPPVDRYIGTNQISLSFDEAERKLKWDLLHFPIMTNSTNPTAAPTTFNNDAVPGVQYNELPGAGLDQANGLSGLAKAYSGIAFTAMSPASFWSQQLGFVNNTIQVQPNTIDCNFPQDAAGVPNSFQIHNSIVGTTITEAACTLDIPVVSSSAPLWTNGGTNGPPGLFARPITSDGTVGAVPAVQVSTADTTSCFASKTYNDDIQEAGYFLVDVSNNFSTKFVGGDLGRGSVSAGATNTGNDTMSIVSRYYTSNNFVADQGAGSIVYTHSGAPQNLTDMAIRVKNPDGSFISESILGPKNSVFISIERAKQIKDLSNVPASKPVKETEPKNEVE